MTCRGARPAPFACFEVGMSFSFGIEEEYFLVDAGPRRWRARCRTASSRPRRQHWATASPANSCNRRSRSSRAPQTDMAAARDESAQLAPDTRRGRERARPRHHGRRHASDRDLGALAAIAKANATTAVMDDLQMIGQRNMLCGMHVHVELPEPGRPGRRDDADAAVSAAVHRARRPRRRSGARSRPG